MEWIRVCDRVPVFSKDVLCLTVNKEIKILRRVHIPEWGVNMWASGSIAYSDFSVTHWMPLPEPPKEA